MTNLTCNLFIFCVYMGGICFFMGGVYPVFMVFMNKVVLKSKLSIKEILKRI